MKIYSNFRDYYDSASAFGIDETIHYKRKKQEINIDRNQYRSFPSLNKYDVIGFCGEIYPFLNPRSLKIPNKKENTLFGDDAIMYTVNDKQIFSFGDYSFDEIFEKDKNQNSWFSNVTSQETYNTLKISQSLKNLFVEFKTPIFFLSGYKKLIINPNLGDLHFYKVKDSVMTFSEISQFLSGVLSMDVEIDTPVGGNEVVGRSKGFDENSFRKEPTKDTKVRRKRKNKI